MTHRIFVGLYLEVVRLLLSLPNFGWALLRLNAAKFYAGFGYVF